MTVNDWDWGTKIPLASGRAPGRWAPLRSTLTQGKSIPIVQVKPGRAGVGIWNAGSSPVILSPTEQVTSGSLITLGSQSYIEIPTEDAIWARTVTLANLGSNLGNAPGTILPGDIQIIGIIDVVELWSDIAGAAVSGPLGGTVQAPYIGGAL